MYSITLAGPRGGLRIYTFLAWDFLPTFRYRAALRFVMVDFGTGAREGRGDVSRYDGIINSSEV